MNRPEFAIEHFEHVVSQLKKGKCPDSGLWLTKDGSRFVCSVCDCFGYASGEVEATA